MSKHHGDFNGLYCLHSFATKIKLESHKKICENKDFCNVIMPFENAKILEFNQYQKSDKAPFIIYADFECVIEKIDECKNNPENSSATKVSKNISSGFSMSAISSFRSIENKHLFLEHAMKIIVIFLKKWKLLTKEQKESYENAKICFICKEKFENKFLKDKRKIP